MMGRSLLVLACLEIARMFAPALSFAAGPGDGAAGWNPLEFTGPEFLGSYATALVILFVLGWVIRRELRLPKALSDDDPWMVPSKLDPYEIAYLAGGAKLAIDTAVVSLAHRQVIEAEPLKHAFSIISPPTEKVHQVEEAVLDALKFNDRPIATIHAAARPALDAIGDRLREAGLLVTGSTSLTARMAAALPIALLLGLGLAKIAVGVSRGRPVGFLVILCALTAGLAALLFLSPMTRSRMGDLVLNRLRSKHTGLQTSARLRGDELPAPDLALAYGLFGAAVIAHGSMDYLRAALIPPSASGAGGITWGSDGGGDSGGSGCGGGGCGGGCGGCGGS